MHTAQDGRERLKLLKHTRKMVWEPLRRLSDALSSVLSSVQTCKLDLTQ